MGLSAVTSSTEPLIELIVVVYKFGSLNSRHLPTFLKET